MHILAICTYPPIECGIATYSKWLLDELRQTAGVAVSVITLPGGLGENVFPVYDPENFSSIQNVKALAAELRPDIVHIQHEYGLYGPNRGIGVLDMYRYFQNASIPVVTTFHTVHNDLDETKRGLLQGLVAFSSQIIVHEEYQRQLLIDQIGESVGRKVSVIDHGVRIVEPIRNGKERFGLEGKLIVLLCGYIRPRKAFHKIIELFPDVSNVVPEAVLVLASILRRPTEYVSYQQALLEQIHMSPCADRIRVIKGELPHEMLDSIISAADVVVLPYEDGAQSGILSNCLAFHRPVITSDLPAFCAILERTRAGIVARNREEYVEGIIDVLQNPQTRLRFESNASRYVAARASWPAVAQLHTQIYQNLLRQ